MNKPNTIESTCSPSHHYRRPQANRLHRRSTRNMHAYILSLRERLEETNYQLLKSIIHIEHEPDKTASITPIIYRTVRRAARLQALLDASRTPH